MIVDVAVFFNLSWVNTKVMRRKSKVQMMSPLNIKFELEDMGNTLFEKGDFQYEINLGDGHFYDVLADGRPYLRVEADTKRLFETAVIYNHYLLVGAYDKVYFIDLWDLGENTYSAKIDVDMYFGYFVTTSDAVYVLDGTGIIAFDLNLNEKWRNHHLAIDGVTFQEIIDCQFMRISCEMDPPGGWIDRIIDMNTGEVKETGYADFVSGR